MQDKSLSIFLANISHEMRTPLNGIIGYLDLLSKEKFTPEQSEYISNARKSSDILLSVINNIIDYSKIEADKFFLDEVEINLYDIVESSIEMFSILAYNKKLEIQTYIHPQTPEYILGDNIKIQQVLNNIINNAIKFTNNGEIILKLHTEKINDEHVNLLFQISDTGIGIKNDIIDRLFKPFEQGDTTTTRKYGGSGLGLAISKKIIDLMKGNIWVNSSVDVGSTFYFNIPVKKMDNKSSINKCNNDNVYLFIMHNNDNVSEIIEKYITEINIITSRTNNYVDLNKLLHDNIGNYIIIMNYNFLDDSIFEILNNYTLISLIIMCNPKERNCVHVKYLEHIKIMITPIRKHKLQNNIINKINKFMSGSFENSFYKNHKISSSLETLNIILKKNIKILIVDDNDINLKLTCSILHGAIIDTANNGLDAVNKYKHTTYDIILMDCFMPIMDGFQATKEIRKIELKKKKIRTPIIALTANTMKDEHSLCYKHGMDYIITKPITANILISKINELVSSNTDIIVGSKACIII